MLPCHPGVCGGTQAQAGKKPNAVAKFEAGIAVYQANDLPLAYKEFLAAAKEGHADSQYNVGLMYEKGIGYALAQLQVLDRSKKSPAREANQNNCSYSRLTTTPFTNETALLAEQ